jgi:hypothetical protein
MHVGFRIFAHDVAQSGGSVGPAVAGSAGRSLERDQAAGTGGVIVSHVAIGTGIGGDRAVFSETGRGGDGVGCGGVSAGGPSVQKIGLRAGWIVAGQAERSTGVRADQKHGHSRVVVGHVRIVTGGAFHFSQHEVHGGVLGCGSRGEQRRGERAIVGRCHAQRMTGREVGAKHIGRGHGAGGGDQTLGDGESDGHGSIVTTET